MGGVRDEDVLRSLDLPPGLVGQGAPGSEHRQRRHAAGWRVGRAAVDVHVMGHVRRALPGAVEVVLHQERAERVGQQLDLGPVRGRLHARDHLVEPVEQRRLLRRRDPGPGDRTGVLGRVVVARIGEPGIVDGEVTVEPAAGEHHPGVAAGDDRVHRGLVVEDGVELAVQLDRDASLQLAGSDHPVTPAGRILGAWLRTRHFPCSMTTITWT